MLKYLCYNWMGSVADHCLDLTREVYKSWGVGRLHDKTLNPEDIKEGDVVFVKTDYIYNGHFQTEILPKIQSPFTLLTGTSSYQVSKGYEIYSIVNSPLVRKWYCTNAPKGYGSKIIPMPIGFEEVERDGGNQELLDRLRKNRTPFKEKKDRVFLPYHTLSTNPERRELFEKLSDLPFVETQTAKLPFDEYVEKMDKYQFVICLEGSGPDVHRNYEALLVDTVPINKANIIEEVFKVHRLPGEFVSSWDDLDKKCFQKMVSKHYNVSGNGEFLEIATHAESVKNE